MKLTEAEEELLGRAFESWQRDGFRRYQVVNLQEFCQHYSDFYHIDNPDEVVREITSQMHQILSDGLMRVVSLDQEAETVILDREPLYKRYQLADYGVKLVENLN